MLILGLVFFVEVDFWGWDLFEFGFLILCCEVIGICGELELIFLLIMGVFVFNFLMLLVVFEMFWFFIGLLFLFLFLLFVLFLFCIILVVLEICDVFFKILFELLLLFLLLLFDVVWGFISRKGCCWFWLVFCMLWNGEFFVLFLLIICCIEWIGVVSCVLWWLIIFNKFKIIIFCKCYDIMYFEN